MLWTGEVGIPHMGWGYYYLVNDKNKDYILFYLPDESQGDIYYTLLVFHFDSEGNQILDENYKISYESDKQWERDLQKFNKLLNKYLENSVLLVSTFEFQLEYDIPKSQAAEDGVEQAVYAERVVGGYNHTFIGSNGETKVCAVTVIEMRYYRKCPECGEIKGYMQTGTRESHSNPSHT